MRRMKSNLVLLDHDEKHRAMVEDDLDVKSLSTDAEDDCRTLLDDNKWPAAMSVKDSKTLSGNHGSVNQAATKDLKKLVSALAQLARIHNEWMVRDIPCFARSSLLFWQLRRCVSCK